MTQAGEDRGSIVFKLRRGAIPLSPDAAFPSSEALWSLLGDLAKRDPSILTPVFGGTPPAGEGPSSVLPYDPELTYLLEPQDDLPMEHLLKLLHEAVPLIEYAEHPSIFAPDVPLACFATFEEADWGISHCGFDQVWTTLDTVQDGPRIMVIDYGRIGLDHPALSPRITPMMQTPRGQPANHAAGVASILAAIRPTAPRGGEVLGCCSAPLIVCDVAGEPTTTNYGFDYCLFQRALRTASSHFIPVVNISMSGPNCDQTTRLNVARTLHAGVSIVASVGNDHSTEPRYPAALDGVIGVGAIGRSLGHLRASNQGAHVWVAAPGEGLRGVTARSYVSPTLAGTSFAAPMVSAAVWLIRLRGVCASQAAVLIAETASKDPRWSSDGRDNLIGYGVLNMPRIEMRLRS